MPQVIVLRPGDNRLTAGGAVQAVCTVSLIRGDGVCVLVDTGGPGERDLIISALAQHRLRVEDVQHVVCTHGHVDHVGNLNLFSRATFLAGRDRSIGDCFMPLDLAAGPVRLFAGVEMLATPGHTSEDLSVLVESDGGVVAIAGDVFENGNPADRSWLELSRSPATQRRSRAALLSRANYIVPGHGAMFATREFRRRTASHVSDL